MEARGQSMVLRPCTKRCCKLQRSIVKHSDITITGPFWGVSPSQHIPDACKTYDYELDALLGILRDASHSVRI